MHRFIGRLTAVLLVCCLVVLTGLVASEESQGNSFELIEADFQSGDISQHDKMFYEMTAIFSPQSLPQNYTTESLSIIKSGSHLVAEVLDNWSGFSAEQQTAMAAFMFRPSMDTVFTSPSGRFNIYYDTAGAENVPPEDLDMDGIPDFVERTAVYADSSAFIYQDFLGYLPPVVDTTGGNIAYDLYLVAIAAYGITIPEGPGDSSWNDCGAYSMIHRNFYGFAGNDDPEGDSIGAQKVTCAHEYFHAIQLAYDNDIDNNLWYMEITATAMEELVFPEVNDNHNYLAFFFNYPGRSLRSTENFHMYGSFIWALYLDLNHTYYANKLAWEACRANIPGDALDSAFQNYGTTMAKVFPRFTIWNYFTGVNAKPSEYFPDAAEYPEPAFDQVISSTLLDSVQPITRPDGLGANYIEVAVDTLALGIIEIELEGSDLVRWGLSAIFIGEGVDTAIYKTGAWGNPVTLNHPYIEDYDKIIIIPSVVSKYQEDNYYYLSTRYQGYGDANYDYDVNIGDAIYIINHVFNGGDGPQPLIECGDANCDDAVNIADAVVLVNFIFNAGDAPCWNR